MPPSSRRKLSQSPTRLRVFTAIGVDGDRAGAVSIPYALAGLHYPPPSRARGTSVSIPYALAGLHAQRREKVQRDQVSIPYALAGLHLIFFRPLAHAHRSQSPTRLRVFTRPHPKRCSSRHVSIPYALAGLHGLTAADIQPAVMVSIPYALAGLHVMRHHPLPCRSVSQSPTRLRVFTITPAH